LLLLHPKNNVEERKIIRTNNLVFFIKYISYLEIAR
jgi:hypothetical protein